PRHLGNSAGTWASWCSHSPLADTRAVHRSADRHQTMLSTFEITSLLDARFSAHQENGHARDRFRASPQNPEPLIELAFREPPAVNEPRRKDTGCIRLANYQCIRR